MPAIDIPALRECKPSIICIGSHPGIIQSMLDFDYLAGQDKPTITTIVAYGRKTERYFFGDHEVVIPVYDAFDKLPAGYRKEANLFINFSSGRRVLATTTEAIGALPGLLGGTVFAERLPERHALELYELSRQKGLWILGGASVGMVVPGHVKLGAIGGTQAVQLEQSRLFGPGQMAVISSSGGMVNEIIRTVAEAGYGVSLAMALGGERFSMVTPEEAVLTAQSDPGTKAIVYFGELGGDDEYRLAELLKDGKITKPFIAYIAGAVAELFSEPPQFGHAKAMATSQAEAARAKAEALRQAGAEVAGTYREFVQLINSREDLKPLPHQSPVRQIGRHQPKLMASSLSYDEGDKVYILGQELLDFATDHSFGAIVAAMFLGKQPVSRELEDFVGFTLKLLVDHGPYVSGAVNTIVTARAGKDLVSSLAAGLLTIGPRFGGAINESAANWFRGVSQGYTPAAFIEEYAARRQYLLGIGHRKYSTDKPDPRVGAVLAFSDKLKHKVYTSFALGVAAQTTQKKANLILNVDGAVAAVLLDLLAEKEGYSPTQLQELIDTEFFNGLFVLSRSVGFMAHYFDQRRLDEGLFRLGPDTIARIEP